MIKDTILEIKNLNKSYGNSNILKDINLTVPKGCIYGFIGENGAGKTTTMNIISGLKKASSGEIIFLGKDITTDSERNNIGYLVQQPRFYEYMTINEYLDFITSLSKDKSFSKEELIEIVGLSEAKNKTISKLSGGMRQRLGIAVAICNNPKLVILDEPTSALDPEGRVQVMNIIKKLKEKGMTVFFSTHLLSDVENICDYITILHKGEVKVSTTIKELKEKYASSYYEVEFSDYIEKKNYPQFIKNVQETVNKTIFYVDNSLNDERKILEHVLSFNSPIKSFVKKELTLEDIYFKVIKGED